MTQLRHAIILGSIREGRFGAEPAHWLEGLAMGRVAATYDFVDLREHTLPLFAEADLPARSPSMSDVGRRWRDLLARFDGFVFVTPEYNHGIPGALKNALDYAYPEFVRKPAAFLGYGGAGAARAVEQLRLNLVEMQMAPVRHAVHIAMPDFGALVSGKKELGDFSYLATAAQAMLGDLEWWSAALRSARMASGRPAAAQSSADAR
jgi:NAD(P)H-dependent FMN reductase